MDYFHNAEIAVKPTRLNFPLKTLWARQYASFRAIITGVPKDLSAVFLRIVSSDNTSYSDFSAIMLPEQPNAWRVSIPAVSLVNTGSFIYELHGTTDDEQKAALGRGTITVQPFTAGDSAATIDTPVVVAQLPTRDGNWVNCWATMDSTGEYTYDIEPVTSDEEAAT